MSNIRETFVVGIDGSDCSRRAAGFAAERARKLEAKIVLLGVIEWSRYSFYTPEELETRSRDRSAETRRVETQVLEPLAKDMMGLEVSCTVRHGHAADTLRAVAEEVGATQIFIGRQGHSSFGDAFFGGVTNRIVSTATVPVTVVP